MKTWEELAEVQPLVSKMISRSIEHHRVSHAYLIQGQKGVGKEATAQLLAQRLFCEQAENANPCQACVNCRRIESRNHPDVHWIEPEGKSIGKEQVEDLQREFIYSGLESKQKVYIIKSAETLTTNASNRILKFLEEPNQQTTAILLTENSRSIIPTIRSRCQVLDLQPLAQDQLRQQLMAAGVSEQMAKLTSALTNNIDEAIAWSEDDWFVKARKIVLQLFDKFLYTDTDAFLFLHQQWLSHFKDYKQHTLGLDMLLLHFKDVLYAQMEKEDALITSEMNDERIRKAVLTYSKEKILAILQAIIEAKQKIRQHVQATLVLEQLTLHIQR